MADKPNIRSDKDSLMGMVKQEQEEVLPKIKAKPVEDVKGNPKAESFWSTGRGCPQCAGDLAHFELNTDSGILQVYCKYCGKHWYHTDLDTDELYRMIPLDFRQRCMAMFEARNRAEGKE